MSTFQDGEILYALVTPQFWLYSKHYHQRAQRKVILYVNGIQSAEILVILGQFHAQATVSPQSMYYSLTMRSTSHCRAKKEAQNFTELGPLLGS
jgi:hypothetical protein